MAADNPWFPGKRTEQNTMIVRSVNFMNNTAKRNAIGFETTSQNGIWYDTVLYPKLNTYITAYNAFANPLTGSRVAGDNLRDAEKLLFPLYRKFHRLVVASPLITNGQLEELGFPARPGGGKTPHPVDSAFVSIKLLPVGNLAINVAFEDRDTEKSKVPYYMTGVVIFFQVSDEPATDQNKLPKSELATRSPYKLHFDPTQQGQYLSVAARWQNRRGEKGPWSQIVTIVIP